MEQADSEEDVGNFSLRLLGDTNDQIFVHTRFPCPCGERPYKKKNLQIRSRMSERALVGFARAPPMKKDPDIPTTSTTEIERLIERVEQGKLDQADTQRTVKLLRLFLTLLNLIQTKNMKMGRLRDLLFGIKKKLLKENQSEKDQDDKPKPDSPAKAPSKGIRIE